MILGTIILITTRLFVTFTIVHLNPVVYFVSGFRWSFYGVSDVNIVVSFIMTVVFLLAAKAAGLPKDKTTEVA